MILFFVYNCCRTGGIKNIISRFPGRMRVDLKVIKGIFFFIMSLIMVLCLGVLICAVTPSLTDMLAEKVESLTSAQAEGNGTGSGRSDLFSGDGSGLEGILPGLGGAEGTGLDDNNGVQNGTGIDTAGVPSGAGGDTAGVSSGEVQPGVNADWMRDGNQTGYEMPESQPAEVPASVSGRNGYEPVQEEAEQILPEEADDLTENAPLGNTGSDLVFDSEFYPYYAMLEADMRQLYGQIYANAVDMVQSFAPVTAVNVNQLKTVFEAVYNDHPELFWLETGYSCKYLRNGNCVEITLKYNAAAENLEEARQEFDSRAGQILSGAQALGSNAEKERFVHDSLMQSVEYVLNAPMNQSAYSALVQGRSVCAGYARAFQYMMQQLGIPCYYCTGYAGEDHAWNIVKMDTDYYNVDVTWDDTDTPTYDYFNKSDREFGTTHIRTGLAVYLPACVSGGEAPTNAENGSISGAGENGAAEGSTGSGDSQAVGSGTQAGEETEESEPVLINPTPAEPLTWQSRTGADLYTEPTEEERKRDALERAGITEEDVRDTMKEYYEDCEKLLKEAGTGNQQFSNVIPEGLWSAVERAYTNGDYWKGYVEDALKALGANSFQINLQVQDLDGGYCRLYHNVYTY